MTRGRRLGVAVVGILAALVLGPAVGAEATVPVILRTDVDLEGTPALLTIRGLNFGAMAIPKVKLAGLDLPVLEHTPTRIVAELPEGIEAATYQLIVQRGGALPITSLPFDVAIGGGPSGFAGFSCPTGQGVVGFDGAGNPLTT